MDQIFYQRVYKQKLVSVVCEKLLTTIDQTALWIAN